MRDRHKTVKNLNSVCQEDEDMLRRIVGNKNHRKRKNRKRRRDPEQMHPAHSGE